MKRSQLKPARSRGKPNRPQGNRAGPRARPNRPSAKPRGLRYQPIGVVPRAGPATVLNRLLYKPVGMLAGLAAAALAALAFRQLWRLVPGAHDTPDPLDEERGWGEVLIGSAVQGALIAVARAAADRSVAHGARRVTGQWPE